MLSICDKGHRFDIPDGAPIPDICPVCLKEALIEILNTEEAGYGESEK